MHAVFLGKEENIIGCHTRCQPICGMIFWLYGWPGLYDHLTGKESLCYSFIDPVRRKTSLIHQTTCILGIDWLTFVLDRKGFVIRNHYNDAVAILLALILHECHKTSSDQNISFNHGMDCFTNKALYF